MAFGFYYSFIDIDWKRKRFRWKINQKDEFDALLRIEKSITNRFVKLPENPSQLLRHDISFILKSYYSEWRESYLSTVRNRFRMQIIWVTRTVLNGAICRFCGFVSPADYDFLFSGNYSGHVQVFSTIPRQCKREKREQCTWACFVSFGLRCGLSVTSTFFNIMYLVLFYTVLCCIKLYFLFWFYVRSTKIYIKSFKRNKIFLFVKVRKKSIFQSSRKGLLKTESCEKKFPYKLSYFN